MIRRTSLAGLTVAILGFMSVAWMPTDDWQPVPDPVMAEVTPFFASLDQAGLNEDADGVMAHYVRDIMFRLEAADGTFIRTIDAAIVRQGATMPPGIDRSSVKHFKHERVDFQYQPGPTDAEFAIRFKNYLFRADGTREALPSHDTTCVFIRDSSTLLIELQIVRTLKQFDSMRLPFSETPGAPATSDQPHLAPLAPPPPIVPRTTPLRPYGPLAETSLVTAGDKQIDDESSGFRFRLPAGATVEKTASTVGTGWTRYRCELARDGISVVFDLYPLPGGRGVISAQEIQDFLALKPANIRRASGYAEVELETRAGRPFNARWYNEASEHPGRPGRAYRWIGSQYALMVSITCRHPEDMDPVVDRIFRGIHFPEN